MCRFSTLVTSYSNSNTSVKSKRCLVSGDNHLVFIRDTLHPSLGLADADIPYVICEEHALRFTVGVPEVLFNVSRAIHITSPIIPP